MSLLMEQLRARADWLDGSTRTDGGTPIDGSLEREAAKEIERLENEGAAQSELIQREWGSPFVMAGLRKEIERLRAIFPAILKALGSGGCTSDASIEFLEMIPTEVSLVRERFLAAAGQGGKP
jgi:hypothetical protein